MDKLNNIQILWFYDSYILTDNYIVDDFSQILSLNGETDERT